MLLCVVSYIYDIFPHISSVIVGFRMAQLVVYLYVHINIFYSSIP